MVSLSPLIVLQQGCRPLTSSTTPTTRHRIATIGRMALHGNRQFLKCMSVLTFVGWTRNGGCMVQNSFDEGLQFLSKELGDEGGINRLRLTDSDAQIRSPSSSLNNTQIFFATFICWVPIPFGYDAITQRRRSPDAWPGPNAMQRARGALGLNAADFARVLERKRRQVGLAKHQKGRPQGRPQGRPGQGATAGAWARPRL